MSGSKQPIVGYLETLVPVDVLYEFEGPRIFTFQINNDLFLAYQNAEGKATARYLVVPSDEKTIDEIKNGNTAVRDALQQPWSWLVSTDFEMNVKDVSRVCFSKLSEEQLPAPGTMISPDAQPFMTVRLTGEEFGEGNLPGSIIKKAVDGASSAVRNLASAAGRVLSEEGAMNDTDIQKWSDLPAQRFAFGSFEISFRSPLPSEALEDRCSIDFKLMEQITQLLERIIDSDLERDDLSQLHEDEDVALCLLKAADCLSPPQRGLVKEVELSGRILGTSVTKRTLDRDFARKARNRLSLERNRKEKLVTLTGLARAFDKDRMSFILRDIEDHPDVRCFVGEAQYDDAYDAFINDRRVTINGREYQSRIEVTDISVSLFEDE